MKNDSKSFYILSVYSAVIFISHMYMAKMWDMYVYVKIPIASLLSNCANLTTVYIHVHGSIYKYKL